MKTVVLIVHVAAAAVVLGSSLGWGRLLRQSVDAGQAAARVAIADVVRRLTLVRITSFMTLFTGVALILFSGGFAVVPKSYHIALTLMLVSVGWGLLGLAPKVKALNQVAAAPEFDAARFRAGIGKVGMGTGIVHALWLSMLVLMFFRM